MFDFVSYQHLLARCCSVAVSFSHYEILFQAAYNLHGRMMELEAAGKPAFLRDDKGDVVILCNDGNFYCNM